MVSAGFWKGIRSSAQDLIAAENVLIKKWNIGTSERDLTCIVLDLMEKKNTQDKDRVQLVALLLSNNGRPSNYSTCLKKSIATLEHCREYYPPHVSSDK